MLVYGAIAVFGFLLLLIMLFAGDISGDHEAAAHDASGAHGEGVGPGIFSVRVMAAFVTAFGVGGVVARFYELSHPVASGVGTVSGIVMAGLVYEFAKILYSQQASSVVRMAGLVGQSAEVSVAIPGSGVGQIALAVGGERTEHIARSADGRAVPRGTEVVITGMRGDSVVVAPSVPPAAGGSR